MFNTKCGCPDCRGEKVGFTKAYWKSRKNKNGDHFGVCPKPGAKKGHRREAH